jgi:hypothetical protein
MPTYLVTFVESKELTYRVEASCQSEAEKQAGDLWCQDAEPWTISATSVDDVHVAEDA